MRHPFGLARLTAKWLSGAEMGHHAAHPPSAVLSAMIFMPLLSLRLPIDVNTSGARFFRTCLRKTSDAI
jgi:hypothetical protein